MIVAQDYPSVLSQLLSKNWPYYLVFAVVMAVIIGLWLKEDYFPYKGKRK